MANVREIREITARSWALSLPYVTPVTSRDERCRYNRGMTHDSLYDEGLVETVLAAQALATAEEADRISDLLMRYMVASGYSDSMEARFGSAETYQRELQTWVVLKSAGIWEC